MDKTCDACDFVKQPVNLVFSNDDWQVCLGNNHAYLGRAYVTLKSHKGSLSELTDGEWTTFRQLVQVMERAYADAFGARPLNWGYFMNHAFREKPFNPHIHWHIYPRYEVAPELAGMTFADELFGEFYDAAAERIVGQSVVDQIAATLRQHIEQTKSSV